MIPREIPKFINSEFFIPEPGNWHLKEGAPKEIVKEFEEFKKSMEQPKK
jgi:hypothetical protein